VTTPDESWHESLRSEGSPPGSTDRSFGLLFAGVCGLIAMLGLWEGRRSAIWWLVAALIFCIVASLAAPLLGPLNRGWRWLSLQLFQIVNPIIMGLVFFVVLTPIAIIMRQVGRDPLKLRFDPEKPSYWLDRMSVGERQTSMTDQF
jgi:Saxitoxin biosynthesis operon protein SxtJ